MHKLVEKIFSWSYQLFKNWGFGETLSAYLSVTINIIVLAVLSYFIYLLFRFLLVRTMIVVAKKTKTKFDDLLVSNKTAKYIAHLIPLLFIYKCVPVILENFVYWESIFGKLVAIYIVLLSLWIIKTIFHALRDYLKQNPKYSDKPIDSYIQVIMIVLWIFAFIFVVSKIFFKIIRSIITLQFLLRINDIIKKARGKPRALFISKRN